ncbi:MAG: hypothetical protein BWX61_00970 [Bacteroidetes bacterium ADurb.Bin035]|nr:MAG: hypothetical protein BWX61_00970 [Bacteroidetes bacterium ADurb.Bin035]
MCEYEVYIYKVTATGDVLVWSGEQRRRTGSLVENHDDWCTIYCYDWLYALKDRYTAESVIYKDYDNVELLPNQSFSIPEAIGTVPFDDESKILLDDTNYASVTIASSEKTTYLIDAHYYDFEIPADATIRGIEVTVKQYREKQQPTGYAKDIKVFINKTLNYSPILNLATNADLPSTDTEMIYGSDTNLWGLTLTPTEVNNQLIVFLQYVGVDVILNINCVYIKVYYSVGNVIKVTDSGAIAWDLIETSQLKTNGDLGITEGTIATTQDRTRTYNNQNIMEAIINLSDVINGFDFEITDDKVFNVYTVKGDDLTDSLILEYGRNLQSVSIDEDFTTPCNNAIVLGEVIDGTELTRVDRPDTTTQAKYKLREMVLSADNVIDENTLNAKGDAMLYKYKEPLIKVTFEVMRGKVDITQFSLGDLIRLIIKKGCYNIDSTYRIFEWTVDHENDNTEKLSLILGELGI